MALTVKISPSSIDTSTSVAVVPRSAHPRRMQGRIYNAARQDRLNSNWPASNVGPNYDIRSLAVIRDRARDMVKNNPYAIGYMRQMKTNIVGPHGFSFKISPRIREDKFRSNARRIQDKFLAWAESDQCFLDGEHEFVDGQNLLIQYAARDGEFCVRIIRDKRLKFGFTQQIIPIELLDDQYNDVLPNDRIVILGVEYDRRTLRRTAYWFRDIPLEHQIYGLFTVGKSRMRIPAEEIIYGFDDEYINQTRGISWMVQTLSDMHSLNEYDEATLVAARMRATLGGFLINDAEGVEYTGDAEDDEGNYIMELENGIWKQLPPGLKPDFPKTDYPSAQYGPFSDKNLQKQSVGLGVAGSVHSGNYSDVNFSSERARQIAVRDNYLLGQQWFIRRYHKKIGRTFMTEGYLTGQVVYPLSQEDLYMYHVWSGRRWGYVNPEQEMNANAMKWSLGMKSISEMIQESDGEYEPDEVFAQIAEDRKMAAKYGFTITADIKAPVTEVQLDQSTNKPKA